MRGWKNAELHNSTCCIFQREFGREKLARAGLHVWREEKMQCGNLPHRGLFRAQLGHAGVSTSVRMMCDGTGKRAYSLSYRNVPSCGFLPGSMKIQSRNRNAGINQNLIPDPCIHQQEKRYFGKGILNLDFSGGRSFLHKNINDLSCYGVHDTPRDDFPGVLNCTSISFKKIRSAILSCLSQTQSSTLTNTLSYSPHISIESRLIQRSARY